MTLSLVIIAVRMKKSRVLAKNLTVIETLSCVNVIASDKTGTLTQNKMFVASASAGVHQIDLDAANGNSFERTIAFNQLVSTSGLCNNAQFEEDEISIPVRQRKARGDATDIALLRFWSEYENVNEMKDAYDVRAEIPFNSKNKWMVKVIRAKNRDVHEQIFGPNEDVGSDIILLKGAPDYLIKKSTHVINSDGKFFFYKSNEIKFRENLFNNILFII